MGFLRKADGVFDGIAVGGDAHVASVHRSAAVLSQPLLLSLQVSWLCSSGSAQVAQI